MLSVFRFPPFDLYAAVGVEYKTTLIIPHIILKVLISNKFDESPDKTNIISWKKGVEITNGQMEPNFSVP